MSSRNDRSESTEKFLEFSCSGFFDGSKEQKTYKFSLERGQSIGILGDDGSAVLKILVGVLPNPNGDACIDGISLKEHSSKYKKLFEYYGKRDGSNPYMTPREQLRDILKSCKSDNIDKKVESWLRKMDIVEYANRKNSTSSAGTKKKLNLAMAMITESPVIILDHPMSGLDPISRQHVQNCINELKEKEKAFVFAFNNRSEAEGINTWFLEN